ncbi:MmgE/PrpD family protein [Aquabacterium sp.]|uniref:MmgE/PrpD family protein n=1 Tax=Aquabacterium sp. TaxID=1872578 RepID=UPI0027BAE819|nr:MmgE/PrpD family protein [Aquabacterium sp.]
MRRLPIPTRTWSIQPSCGLTASLGFSSACCRNLTRHRSPRYDRLKKWSNTWKACPTLPRWYACSLHHAHNGSPMDKTLQRLAHFVHTARFEQLTPETVRECKRRLIDSVACAAAAYPEPFCERLRAFAQQSQGTPSARIWGSGAATSLEMAAFVNGTMLRYLDFSDTYLSQSAGHPSDMIGGLVAVAEAHHLSGKALLNAIAVAYEIYCGLCDSVALQPHAIDQATCAAVGTAAGVANLLCLNLGQTAQALSLALTPNLHLYNVRCGALSDWKGCAGPNAARNGVFAALLAQADVTGPTAPVEGKGGLFGVVESFDWHVGMRAHPLINDTHLKYHPVCYHGQSAIDAALKLRGSVEPDQIDDIHVETYEASFRVMGSDKQSWHPTTRETADHSLPYTIATALLEGKLTSQAYDADRLSDPRTLALVAKVRVSHAPELSKNYPSSSQTRITIRTRTGEVLSHLQEQPKGHASNPLSDTELASKFIELFAPLGDAQAARQTLAILNTIEQLTDVSTLVDAVCMPPAP